MKDQNKIIIIIVIIGIIITLSLLYLIPQDFVKPELHQDELSGAIIYATGEFQSGDHPTSGTAQILEVNNTFVLRFENFKTDDGPGLYVYLSRDTEATDFISLGELKAIEGNMNYNINTEIELNEYKNVLVWCEPFSVLFGYAQLDFII
ncbi:MAG: DM13 domain-containing protein [Thermoplasmatales archaeon]|nr:MAG: DM13 domain-containing protein [Thermoplasmatales archaeon]